MVSLSLISHPQVSFSNHLQIFQVHFILQNTHGMAFPLKINENDKAIHEIMMTSIVCLSTVYTFLMFLLAGTKMQGSFFHYSLTKSCLL